MRAEQSRLHQLPMWVITSDEKLAVQARQEGFRVGYGERAQSPSPWLVGSPWVDPHTLGLRHIPALDLLGELVQQWGVVTLQEEGKGKLKAWKKTDAKEQALGKPEPFTTHERQQQPWRETRLAHHSSPSAPPPPPESAPVDELEDTVEATLPTPDQQRLLGIDALEPCLALHRRSWSGNRIVTVSTLTYPASRYALYSRYKTSASGSISQ